jgi:hypothetical protein
VTWGANAKPPNNTTGATIADSRPADCRTQRATSTPETKTNAPATKTIVDPPVSGKRHPSTPNIATPAVIKYTFLLAKNLAVRKQHFGSTTNSQSSRAPTRRSR